MCINFVERFLRILGIKCQLYKLREKNNNLSVYTTEDSDK